LQFASLPSKQTPTHYPSDISDKKPENLKRAPSLGESAVAGMNKVLKPGQTVFKAGEAADGMYLVRKGELVVFLEKDGKEVVLAKVGEGGMIGEMALFDRQPRSASVKASTDAEVTLITVDEFSKLMKQIPKWFVGLMSALSSRLRTTNDRLKSLEASGAAIGGPVPTSASSNTSAPSTSAKPFQGFLRTLHILELIWHKDGVKEGKDWLLSKAVVDDMLINVFCEQPAKVNAMVELLVAEQAVSMKQDQYKKPALALANRGSLKQISDFLLAFSKANPGLKSIPDSITNMMIVIQQLLTKAAYDQLTVSLEELEEEGKTLGMPTQDWPQAIKTFANLGEAIKVVKGTSKSGVGLKVSKDAFLILHRQLGTINRIARVNFESS
jgi:CRP-like cAMP-binding protein